MKKYRKIAYIALIITIILCIFFIYKVFASNSTDKEDIKSKSLEEIKYIESKILNLFNKMNNINFENFRLSEEKTDNKTSESESKNDSNKGESSDSEVEKSESLSSNNKLYNLEEQGVLTSNNEIDWNQVKNEAESLYTPLYSMTLDLYQTSTNQDNIINFNREYDNLIKAVKEESKEHTLAELATIYSYIPNFIENCTDDEKEIVTIKTKDNILRAYALLDSEEWNIISNYINMASQEFTRLVTNISNSNNGNKYNINKSYVMINELQNAVQLMDKDIFIIKYKNLIEELQNL